MSDAPNTQDQSDGGDARRRLPSLHPFSLFGYILGALSIVSLADDLNLVVLYGKLEVWFAAYDRLVSMLFGWIDLWWIRLTPTESHIAVVALLIWSSLCRAAPQMKVKILGNAFSTEGESPVRIGVNAVANWGLFVMLPMLLLPGDNGGLVAVLVLSAVLGIALATAMPGRWEGSDAHQDARTLRYEFAVVVASAGFIIVLNYAVFRAIEGG